jgi:hypothetical protein
MACEQLLQHWGLAQWGNNCFEAESRGHMGRYHVFLDRLSRYNMFSALQETLTTLHRCWRNHHSRISGFRRERKSEVQLGSPL